MKIDIVWLPSFKVTLSSADLVDLAAIAAVHYDGTCKASIRRGGILCGFRMAMGDSEEAEYFFTFRELDLVAKILEMLPHMPNYHIGSWYRLQELNNLIRKKLKEANNGNPKPS